MLIVWRGYGWLVPVVIFGMLMLSQLTIDSMYGDGFYTANTWPKYVAIGVASACVGLLGLFLNYIRRAPIVDPETGEVVGKTPSHYLFFIPVEYWALITPAIFYWALS